MFLEDVKVLENKKINDNCYLIKVQGEKIIQPAEAGQFFMLQTKDRSTLLRRPISLHYANKENNILEFYYEIKGKGTKEFSSLKPGEIINIQGPLGHGFTTNIKNETIVTIGGGMGIAPMKYLMEELSKNNKVIFIAGGRDKNALNILDNINLKNIETFITTDDGSMGINGNVCVPLKEILESKKINRIYSCGPKIMMKYIAEMAKEYGVYCEVSLEERMACGVKACVGCSILTKEGMKKVCHDGPVFNAEIIEF